MNTPAPTPANLATRLLEHAAVHDAEASPYSPEQAQWAADLRAAAAALSSPAPAQAVPSAQQIVAWHVHFPGCNGTADWVELGAKAPDAGGWAMAVVLPLVHAQSPQAAPLLQDADRALSKALAATPEAYRRPKAAPSAVPEDRVRECAQRLVDAADFQLGGALSAQSKAKEIPSKAVSQVKARHLAALRDALAAAPVPAAPVVAAQLPEVTSSAVNDACWAFVDALPEGLSGRNWNGLKPALYSAIKVIHAKHYAAPKD